MKRQFTIAAVALAVSLSVSTAKVTAQTASNLICNGCVGASDIASGAVKSAEIANSTIVSSDIKDGSINSQDLRNSAVTGAKIKNFTITSVDILPNLNLGKAGDDGDFTVKNASGTPGVRLNGDGANITNLFSAAASQSNGVVKAWARINGDGTIHSCWRCNTDPAVSRRLSTGNYKVDFTPLASDITSRPVAVTERDNVLDSTQAARAISTLLSASDLSAVFVATQASTTGAVTDTDFTVMLF